MKKPFKLVYVEWEESRQGISSWQESDNLKVHDLCLVRSVGWLLQSTKKLIQIVPHVGDNPEQGCGDMTIPRSAIRKMVALNIPGSRERGAASRVLRNPATSKRAKVRAGRALTQKGAGG